MKFEMAQTGVFNDRTDTNGHDPVSMNYPLMGPKYLHRDYVRAKVYTIWEHAPFGF